MEYVSQLLIFLHIAAMVAGGANGVIQMLTGRQMAKATLETRAALYTVQDAADFISKVAMAILLATGVLALWLKWDFTPPNLWFWVKMAGVAAMLTFIVLSAGQTPTARSGGPRARQAIAAKVLYGKLIMAAFAIVLLGVVLAFR